MVLNAPLAPVLASQAQEAIQQGTDGSISFTTTVSDGTYKPQELIVSSNSGTISGLSAGTYDNMVSNAGCTSVANIDVVLMY